MGLLGSSWSQRHICRMLFVGLQGVEASKFSHTALCQPLASRLPASGDGLPLCGSMPCSIRDHTPTAQPAGVKLEQHVDTTNLVVSVQRFALPMSLQHWQRQPQCQHLSIFSYLTQDLQDYKSKDQLPWVLRDCPLQINVPSSQAPLAAPAAL